MNQKIIGINVLGTNYYVQFTKESFRLVKDQKKASKMKFDKALKIAGDIYALTKPQN